MAKRVNIFINNDTVPIVGELVLSQSAFLRYNINNEEFIITANVDSLTIRKKGETSYSLFLKKSVVGSLEIALGNTKFSPTPVSLTEYNFSKDDNSIGIYARYEIDQSNHSFSLLAVFD